VRPGEGEEAADSISGSARRRGVTTAAQRTQRAADLILGTFQDSEDTREAPAPMA
jgi:hypothetical protein